MSSATVTSAAAARPPSSPPSSVAAGEERAHKAKEVHITCTHMYMHIHILYDTHTHIYTYICSTDGQPVTETLCGTLIMETWDVGTCDMGGDMGVDLGRLSGDMGR